MRAYRIAIAILIFAMSAPILTVIGIPAPSGEEAPVLFSNIALSDWGGLLLKGLGMFAVGIAASYVGFRMNAGAMIFAVVFTVSTLPLQSTLNYLTETYGVPSAITADPFNPNTPIGLIPTILWFVFIFAFIQIAGSGGQE